MPVYRTDSPNQSSSSLSDEDEDDLDKTNFFATEQLSPAQWSIKLRATPKTKAVKQTPASRLPPEILIHVLRQLNSVRDLHSALLVCRSWCECSVELLWHKPNLVKPTNLFKMIHVLRRQDQSFAYSQFIRRLNFSLLGNDVAPHVLTALTVCIRLERLTLMNCTKLTDDSLIRLFKHCPGLVALDLTNVVATTDAAITTLAKGAPRLQGLNISNCLEVTDVGILAIARHCRLLRRLKLAAVSSVTDDSVAALAQKCPLLLELDLTKCVRVTDRGLRELWTHSVHMRELKLVQCVDLSAHAHPVAPSPVNPFTDGHAPPEDAFADLVLSHKFEHLRLIDLAGCALLTDEAVAGIVAYAPKIRNLGLAKCSGLTDTAIESICKLGRHLHDLHLGHVNRITDYAISLLARACTRLRYVDLACCTQLTDMAVFELATLPKLRRIGLVRVTHLTDQAVFALADRHATLERIHLSYCENITVPAIHFLLQKLHKLTHLSLTGVPTFRTPELQQFCRSPPMDFTNNQRAAFCVYSGKGIHDLRKHLQTFMSNLADGMGNGRSDTEDDEEDEEFPSAYEFGDPADDQPIDYLDAHHDQLQLAFASQPNINRVRGAPYPHIPHNSTPDLLSSNTTPSPFEGQPPQGVRTRRNAATNGHLSNGASLALYGGQAEASTSHAGQQVTQRSSSNYHFPWAPVPRHPARIRDVLADAGGVAMGSSLAASASAPRLPFQEPPTPPTRASLSAAPELPLPGGQIDTLGEDDGRGRRVRRSLRGALGAAEQYANALFGRRQASTEAPGSANGNSMGR